MIKFGSAVRYAGLTGVVLELNSSFDPPLVVVEWSKKDFRGDRISGWMPINMLEIVEGPKVEKREMGDFE